MYEDKKKDQCLWQFLHAPSFSDYVKQQIRAREEENINDALTKHCEPDLFKSITMMTTKIHEILLTMVGWEVGARQDGDM